MQHTVVVNTPSGQYSFVGEIHETADADHRKIDTAFYEQISRNEGCPQGVHHEIELNSIPGKKPQSARLHIRKHPATGVNYVCWTGHLPTLDKAKSLFEAWCVGTVYTIENDLDFGSLFTPGDLSGFFATMRNFGITHT